MASGLPVPDPGIEALGAGTALHLQANQLLDQRGDVAPHCSLIRQLQAFDSPRIGRVRFRPPPPARERWPLRGAFFFPVP